MFNTLKAGLSRLATSRSREQSLDEDPLMHPDIQAMDLNQLADLPMWAGRYRDDGTLHRRDRQGYSNAGEARGVASRHIRRLSIVAPAALTLLTGIAIPGADALAQSLETTAAFSMPVNVDQWRPDVLGQNGAYRFRQINGNCQITFGQNRGADASRAGGEDVRHSIDAYIDRVATEVGKVERVEVDAVELKSDAGEMVPFASTEFAYLGKDNVGYHNRISVAWIGDVELLIVAACPSTGWLAGRPLIDAFVEKASVTQYSDP